MPLLSFQLYRRILVQKLINTNEPAANPNKQLAFLQADRDLALTKLVNSLSLPYEAHF